MDELTGNRAAPPPLPILTDDLLLEILMRLPPEPIYLSCASLVSKHWCGLVHDAGFLCRFREFHGGTPPVLGFFNNQPGPPFFVPTASGFAASTAAKMSHKDFWALFVLDLVTGDQRYLPMPPTPTGVGLWYAAAGHGDCRSCPFLVVYVCGGLDSSGYFTSACVYSSETGVWGEMTSVAILYLTGDFKQTALVGNTLYWLLDNCSIFEFDLDSRGLGLTTETIPSDLLCSYGWEVVIMPTEDGLLGCAGVQGFELHLWSTEKGIDGEVTWTRQRVIDLKKLLAPEVVATCMARVKPIGFPEEPRLIFIYVHSTVYMLHLKSMEIEEVSEKGTYDSIYPYASFYSAGTSIVCDIALFTSKYSDCMRTLSMG